MRRLIVVLSLLPLAFTWNLGQRSTQQPVEQQTPGGATQPDPSLWVVNPQPGVCAWDADDTLEARGFGDLAPGETAERHECMYGDWQPHLFNAQVSAKTPSLIVEIGWSNADALRSFTVAGVPGAKNYTTWLACFFGPDYDVRSPLLPAVAGSNGGTAQPTDFFARVTNVGARAARGVSIFTTVEPSYHPCPDGRELLDFTREDVVPSQLWWYRP